MKESDFPQFDDPRVRDVFAAAANLVGYCSNMAPPSHCWDELDDLKTALFAAQHSKPKAEGHAPQLANFCKGCGHIAWIVHLEAGLCLACQEAAQHPKPSVDALAFIAACEEKAHRRRTPAHRTHDDDGMPVDRNAEGYDISDD